MHRDHGFHDLRVKAVVEETADTKSFVLDVPEELRAAFRYRAGQFCTFRGPDELLRCYSMSSAPETDADLTVTVKRVPGGRVSNWFNDEVATGAVLAVTAPAGTFCPTGHDRPVVAFCGGSGVTPVLSIAKSVLATTTRPVHVLYANRDRRSVIFDTDLATLAAAHADRLEVRHHFDSDGGFLDAAAIVEHVGDRLDADFYICGPTPFMDLVEGALHGLGVEADRIAIERFGALPPPVPVDAPPTGGGPTELTLVLKGKRHVVAYQAGDTVLETARRGGLPAPYSCQAGDCATCMALVREGGATMRRNNALTPDEVDEGWVLTCQAIPEGDPVTIEYESL
ncbi:MAG: Ferredoxin-NADP reductase [Actinomycetia bacterium]|nr:Ferredoxin-NADP reductase [Actinomycetes bacterium]